MTEDQIKLRAQPLTDTDLQDKQTGEAHMVICQQCYVGTTTNYFPFYLRYLKINRNTY